MATRPGASDARLLAAETRAAGAPAQRIAAEQAALRRVATLIAQAATPEDVFSAVAAEVGQVLEVDQVAMGRFDPDGTATVLAAWTRTGEPPPVPAGGRLQLGGRNVTTLVFQTGQPARLDDLSDASGQPADFVRAWGGRAAVGVPISVEGTLWGGMITIFRDGPAPAGTESRLASFTELAATAIASAQARVALRGFAEEQAALRRVAMLVARGAPPDELFAAVATEAGQLAPGEFTLMSRYDPDGMATVVGAWAASGVLPAPVGTRLSLGGHDLHTLVSETGQPARIDDYEGTGMSAGLLRRTGVRSAAGVPISVDGRLWGVIGTATAGELPPDVNTRLTGFTELVATAIANAESQAALTASRARIVAAADAARRRVERDLHDGAQQRLVSLALRLRAAQAGVPADAGELGQQLDSAARELAGVLEELREIAQGIHPAALVHGGLRPALGSLARRCAIPVSLDVQVEGRLPEPLEVAAYYAVAEALAGAVKHGRATSADARVSTGDRVLRVRVRDDGRGGATFTGGAGLAGIKDRVEALGGSIWLHSPPGAGTEMQIVLPCDGPAGAGS